MNPDNNLPKDPQLESAPSPLDETAVSGNISRSLWPQSPVLILAFAIVTLVFAMVAWYQAGRYAANTPGSSLSQESSGAAQALKAQVDHLTEQEKHITSLSSQLGVLQGSFAQLEKQNNDKVRQIETHTTEALGEIEQTIAEIKGSLTEMRQQFQGALAQNQQENSKFQQTMALTLNRMEKEINQGKEERTLAEVAHYVALAEHRLEVEKDPNLAVKALQAALQRVSWLKRGSYDGLKNALGTDIKNLTAVKTPDWSALSHVLAGMQQDLALLTLSGMGKNHDVSNKDAPIQPDVPMGFWDNTWESVKHGLSKVITIRRQGEPVAPLMAPDQAFFLYQNLRLKLEAARLAVLRHDQQSYHDSLSLAQEWLSRYFNNQAQKAQEIQTLLKSLLQENVEPNLPSISASVKWVQEIGSPVSTRDGP